MTKWEDLMEDEDQLGPLPADWDIPDELRSQFKAPEPEPEPELEPDEDPWPSSPEEVFPSTKGLAQTLENLLLWTGEPWGGSGVSSSSRASPSTRHRSRRKSTGPR
jgi:hypothetical protein